MHLEDFGLLTSYLCHALYTTIVIVKHSAINRFDLLDEVHRSDINFYFAEMDLLIWIKKYLKLRQKWTKNNANEDIRKGPLVVYELIRRKSFVFLFLKVHA